MRGHCRRCPYWYAHEYAYQYAYWYAYWAHNRYANRDFAALTSVK